MNFYLFIFGIITFLIGIWLSLSLKTKSSKLKQELADLIYRLQIEVEITNKNLKDLVKQDNSSSVDRHINVIKSLVKDKEDFEILKESAINMGKTTELLSERLQIKLLIKSLEEILDKHVL